MEDVLVRSAPVQDVQVAEQRGVLTRPPIASLSTHSFSLVGRSANVLRPETPWSLAFATVGHRAGVQLWTLAGSKNAHLSTVTADHAVAFPISRNAPAPLVATLAPLATSLRSKRTVLLRLGKSGQTLAARVVAVTVPVLLSHPLPGAPPTLGHFVPRARAPFEQICVVFGVNASSLHPCCF